MNRSRRQFLTAVAAATALPTAAGGAEWTSLFDGRTLQGWKAEGQAAWSVEDGAIVGRQGGGGGSGDLFTEQQWADFELTAEWKMKWPGNSGIWFRRAAPGTGYQADFLEQDSHPGVLSGSLYCMGKQFIGENRDPGTFDKNGWNPLRIHAVGDDLVVELNGAVVVQVRDNTFPTPGSIGIQAHAGKHFQGMEIRVREIRIRPL